MIGRRDLLKGFAGFAAGLILPSTIVENTEATRRYWALDRTMLPLGTWQVLPNGRRILHLWGQDFLPTDWNDKGFHDFMREQRLNHRDAPSPGIAFTIDRHAGIVTLNTRPFPDFHEG
jgi:hypothetical protein